ncbi:fimbrial biogenesis chaperone [Providencia rettgeri]|nr:molecular chaperone [Providencia rettgeri]
MLLRFLAAFTLIFFSLAVSAEGISLNQSRIVFPQSEKSQTAQILNDTDKPVLVQATILKDIEGESIDKFIVTPPLFKVEPRKEFSMRVFPNNVSDLPKDRESIFYLKTRVIPSTNKSEDSKSLVFVTAFVIKLIYRPDNIDVPDVTDFKKITLDRKGNKWQFNNPTPYYMTLVGLSIDGDIKQGSILIAPFDSYSIDYQIKNPTATIWYFLNDFGVTTDKHIFGEDNKKS